MQSPVEQERLVQLVRWIDENTAGLSFPTDDRTMLALGCFDVAIEHQAAIALLTSASIYGSAFALLRVLTESLVRGLWLHACATDTELAKFKRGKLDKTFAALIEEYELKIGTPSGVLSNFKTSAPGMRSTDLRTRAFIKFLVGTHQAGLREAILTRKSRRHWT